EREENPHERRTDQEIGDQIRIDAFSKLSPLDRLAEKLVDRLAARSHDALTPRGRELGVAMELAEETGQDPAAKRIGEEPDDLVDLVKQDGVDVFALQDVELGGEIVDRVRDELLLRAPAPV